MIQCTIILSLLDLKFILLIGPFPGCLLTAIAIYNLTNLSSSLGNGRSIYRNHVTSGSLRVLPKGPPAHGCGFSPQASATNTTWATCLLTLRKSTSQSNLSRDKQSYVSCIAVTKEKKREKWPFRHANITTRTCYLPAPVISIFTFLPRLPSVVTVTSDGFKIFILYLVTAIKYQHPQAEFVFPFLSAHSILQMSVL